MVCIYIYIIRTYHQHLYTSMTSGSMLLCSLQEEELPVADIYVTRLKSSLITKDISLEELQLKQIAHVDLSFFPIPLFHIV